MPDWGGDQDAVNLEFLADGTAKLQYDSATQVGLGLGVIPLRVNGAWLMRAVTAEVTLGTGGLSASTVYRVYAYDNGGATTLEASATAHATDATFGVEIKSGDPSRTLVGLLRTNASTQFEARFTRTYFGRSVVTQINFFTAGRALPNNQATFLEVHTEIRVEVVVFADGLVTASFAGEWGNNTAGHGAYLGIGVDGNAPTEPVTAFYPATTATSGTASVSIALTLAEGYHFFTIVGKAYTSGIVTCVGGATAGQRMALRVTAAR
jgi:hypothetical protein